MTRGRPSQCAQKNTACFVFEYCARDKKMKLLELLTLAVIAALSQCLTLDLFVGRR